MKTGWFLLVLAMLWLAFFGSTPGSAVTFPHKVRLVPPL